ncbi:MAG: Rne/Rng family ribonuclease [Paludibacteraceae bacterium]|nr:Rne/Rng family ribonuclease [Paludibacteraceae bacterium]MBP6284893.1 Rne/Rng family ribonuclease [Paludibacteraceae bacterium]
MNNTLLLDVQSKEISIALMENNTLVEFSKEPRDISFSVGDIFLAKVKKIMPGLNATFVDVGYEKDAFLHYLDLGSNFLSIAQFTKTLVNDRKKLPSTVKLPNFPDLEKDGFIADTLKSGQEILVQITKEPISTKGPRLTAEISIAGRSLVLLPFSNKISISQKIKSEEERNRLRQLLVSIKPKNFGVIIRTVAEGKKVAELDAELKVLVKRWEETVDNIQKAKHLPSLILKEMSRAETILRDSFNPSFQHIYVNEETIFEEIQAYVGLIAPDKSDVVKLYTGDIPIFDSFNLTKQIKSSFGKITPIKNGAYLIIEHTEALHVIDVNSGNRSKAGNVQETNALEVNLASVDEVARQLRLRDMGGIIVIDLIDMQENEHRQQVFDRMRERMQNDSAKHNILPLSKFGLMQITRQRVRPQTLIDTQETCPTCHGDGKIRSSLFFVDMLETKLDEIKNAMKIRKCILFVHPFVYAYISAGIWSIKTRWQLKFGLSYKVLPNQSYSYLQYGFFDIDGNEIDVKDSMDMV